MLVYTLACSYDLCYNKRALASITKNGGRLGQQEWIPRLETRFRRSVVPPEAALFSGSGANFH